MKREIPIRKLLAGALSLALAAGLALPVRAVEETAPTQAEAPAAEAPAKEETPAVEAPAKEETPAEETPAKETSAETEKAPAEAKGSEAPAVSETPAETEEAPAEEEAPEAPAASETPAASQAPAASEAPAGAEQAQSRVSTVTRPTAVSRPAAQASAVQLEVEEVEAETETEEAPDPQAEPTGGTEGAAALSAADEETGSADADGQAPDPAAAYGGITIDGDFADWDAVPRYAIADTYDIWGNEKGYDTVDQVSVVWDGEYVYILLVAQGSSDGSGNWNSVCGAGPNNNGQFAIVTDLNYQLLIQPAVVDGQPSVSGVDDALVAVNNTEWFGAPHMWEIAIPAERLPSYLETIDFGLYLVDPVITGISDLQGGDGTDKSFNGVVIDGSFADWTYYPMTTIEYATPGTQDTVRDAHGALWADDNILYGYVASNMTAHLAAQGGDFLADISLAFNGDRDFKEYPTDGNFYPRIVSFDSGEAVVLNEGTTLEPGDYTFYIFDVRTDPTAGVYDAGTNTTDYPTTADLKDSAFGVMKVHVDGVLDQAEFSLDLDKVAAYIDKDGDTAFKTVEIQWGRLGQQWITYAGTPTGPVISVCLLIGAVGAPMCYTELKRRREAKKKKERDGEA